MNKTRSYSSPVREEQMEQTRRAIVEALTQQVFEESLADFSVPKVAKRAGVSTRTVYRYFPTRDDLLAAVEAHMREVAPEPAPPQTIDEMPGYAGTLFRYFDNNRELTEAFYRTRLGTEIVARSRARRRALARKMVDELLPDIEDERERLKEFGIVRALISSATWRTLTREVGLSTEEAIEITERTIAQLVAQHDKGKKDRRRRGVRTRS